MPTIHVLTPPESTAEPVSLAMACAQCSLDLDLTATDAFTLGQLGLLQLKVSAAREKVEAYTGRYFAPQLLKFTYRLDEPYVLPAGATATAVAGFYTTLEALADASAFLEEYRKGITVNRELDWPYPALSQTYTVTVEVAPAFVPALAKEAILELVGEAWRNRESSLVGAAVSELPVNWRVKLSGLVLNPIGDGG